MRLQNRFLLNILRLWKASIGCYFLLLLVSPYSCAVLMWADFVGSGGLNGIWLKSEHPTTTVSQFDFVGLFIWEFRKTPLASKKGGKKKKQLFFQVFFSPVWLKEKQRKSHIVYVFLAMGLPLFIKPRQIQLACGLPPNLINLLSCEKLNSPCQYLISPAADKISSRYSMGFPFTSASSQSPAS